MKTDILNLVSWAVLAVLAIVFLSVLVIFNNDGFTLSAFLLFAALAFALALDNEYIRDTLLLSVSLISASSIVYFGIYSTIYIAAALAVFAVILLRRSMFKDSHLLFIFLALFLPVLLSRLMFKDYVINVTIIGYYLMIAAALATLIRAIVANSSSGKALARYYNTIIVRNRKALAAVSILISLALLLGPIWPTGTSINYGALPYVPFSVPSGSVSGSSHAIVFNASLYQKYENANLSNIRFYSQDGSELEAAILTNRSNVSTRATVLLEKLNTSRILLKFLPKNVSFDRYLRPVGNASAGPSELLAASFGSLSGGYNYTNRTYQHLVYLNQTRSSELETVADPFYLLEPLCSPGDATKATLNIEANVTSSLFVFNNISSFSKALSGSSSSYLTDLAGFGRQSVVYELNQKNFSLSLPFVQNSSCVFYSVVFNSTAKLRIRTKLSYYANAMINISISEPEVPNGSRYITYRTDFLPSALRYLFGSYNKVFSNATSK